MTDLTPLTPLGGTDPRVDTIGAITVTEVTSRALASVHARKDQDVTKGFKALGFKAAPEICRLAEVDDHMAWWMGAGQWLVDGAYTGPGILADTVKAAMGDTASVTDQSEGFCRYDIEGECVPLLQRLCPVDVETMSVGDAQRAPIHHMACVILRTDRGFSILGAHSSAGSLHHALVEVAAGL